jgi:arylsulfatase A-like enzyme
VLAACLWLTWPALADDTQAPRLVLQITVDQLRGDMLSRHRAYFGPGGFRRLVEQGTWYTNAHYGSGNTFTASGHAVLVTGADTAEHGMVANRWWDRTRRRTVDAVHDDRHGSSPLNLTSTTIGDEIVAASAGRARAFAVAGKPRSAVIPAGHRGRPYWYSESNGTFGNSSYYGTTTPAWVRAWNERRPADRYRGRIWTPLAPVTRSPPFADTSNPSALPFAVGRTFPHRLPSKPDVALFEGLTESPFFDELVLGFARELIAQEKLGQGPATDYLSVSLASLDYAGHSFGPESLEYVDTLARVDAGLAELLAFVDQQVGKGRTLVVLSADHGVDDIPETRRLNGYDAGRIYPDRTLELVNATLAQRFAGATSLAAAFVPPGLYLDHERVAAAGLDLEVVERALADAARSDPGIAYAIPRSDLRAGGLPRTALMGRMQRGFHPERSGDVVVVQRQFWFLYPEPECCAAMHGSPYAYDTFVPLIFAGPGVAASRIARDVEPASIPATIAALLRIAPPSGNSAPALDEIVGRSTTTEEPP